MQALMCVGASCTKTGRFERLNGALLKAHSVSY
jgi:hypothetical protein